MIVKGWFVPSTLHPKTSGIVMTIEMCFPNISYVQFHDFIIHDEHKKLDYVATLFTDGESNLPEAFRIMKFFDVKPVPTEKQKTTKPATTTKPQPKAKTKEVKKTK